MTKDGYFVTKTCFNDFCEIANPKNRVRLGDEFTVFLGVLVDRF